MRYVLIIADGGAIARADQSEQSEQLDQADLFNVLERAHTPALDAMGRLGRVGLAETRVAGAGSFGRGALALLGVPSHAAAGASDALLRAAAMRESHPGIDLHPGDAVLRIGLVRVSADDSEGLMIGGTEQGVIEPAEHSALFDDLCDHWRGAGLLGDGVEIVRTPAGERLLIVRPDDGQSAPCFVGVEMIEPGSIIGEPWVEHLPDGGRAGDAEMLCALITESRRFLAEHAVNSARTEQGLDAVNLAWFDDAGFMADGDVSGHLGEQPAAFIDDAGADGSASLGSGLCALLGVTPVRASGADLVEQIGSSRDSLAIVLASSGIEAIDDGLVAPLINRFAGEPVERVTDADDASWRVERVARVRAPVGVAGCDLSARMMTASTDARQSRIFIQNRAERRGEPAGLLESVAFADDIVVLDS
jgi:2,3-bisphosphoglycerate-independent phosphoglycerate mutase